MLQISVRGAHRSLLSLPARRFTGNSRSIGERFRFAAVKSETLENDLLLAVIKHVEQPADLVTQVLVAQQFKRRLRVLIANDLTELGGIIVANRRIKRSWTDRYSL